MFKKGNFIIDGECIDFLRSTSYPKWSSIAVDGTYAGLEFEFLDEGGYSGKRYTNIFCEEDDLDYV